MRKKRAITLLEIMIVILLIGLIGGVVSYNLKGTLDKGKAFSSREGAKKLEDILNLELQQSNTVRAEALTGDETFQSPHLKPLVLNSGLISNNQIDKFLKDGWGNYFKIAKIDDKNEVTVSSTKLTQYDKDHGIAPINN
jgi:type II secretory pathway pseudopilin PulG